MNSRHRQNKKTKKNQRRRLKALDDAARAEAGRYISLLKVKEKDQRNIFTSLSKESLQTVAHAIRWAIRDEQLKFKILQKLYPKSYEQFAQKPLKYPLASLQLEANWASSLVVDQAEKINWFLAKKQEFEDSLMAAHYEAAESSLEGIVSEIGVSLWAIESRLLLAEYRGGLSENKSFLTSVQDAIPDQKFVLYLAQYWSEKVEREMSSDNYDQRVKLLLQNPQIRTRAEKDPGFATIIAYIDFMINPFCNHPHSDDSFSFILYHSSSYSLIDLYNSYIKTALIIASDDQYSRLRLAISDSVSMAAAVINDSRFDLINRLWGHGGELAPNATRDTIIEISDAYTSGNYSMAAHLSAQARERHPSCLEYYELEAKSILCSQQETSKKEVQSLSQSVFLCMFDVLDKRENTAPALAALKKIAYSLDSTRFGNRLFAFWLEHRNPDHHLRYRRLGGLNAWSISGQFSIACDAPLQAGRLLDQLRRAHPKSITIQLFYEITRQLRTKTPQAINLAIPRERLAKYEAFVNEKCDHLSNAVLGYREVLELSPGVPTHQHDAITGLFRCYLQGGELDRCADLMVDVFFSQESLLSPVPLGSLLEAHNSAGFERYSPNLSWPVLYTIYYQKNNITRNKTTLFILYDTFLTSRNVARPSELAINVHKYHKFAFIYFLRFVCVPEIMDSAVLSFSSTEDVEHERIAICQILSEMDGENRPDYSNEITRLRQAGAIRRAIHEVDNSKVYVDISNIRRTLDKSVNENFDRLRSVSRLDGRIRKAIANISLAYQEKPIALLDGAFYIKLQMFNEIKNRFTSANEYGLDSYLGTRIRHGTLSGQLRSGIEKSRLITRKDTDDGIYNRNHYWYEMFSDKGLEIAERVDVHLKDFSRHVDTIIDEVNNKWIQIRSEIHTAGLFNFNYDYYQLQDLFDRIDDEAGFDKFFDAVIEELRARTEQNLALVREAILGKMRDRLLHTLSEAESKISVLASGPTKMAFSNAVSQCRTTIQNELKTVASWFINIDERAIADFDFRHLIATSIEVVRKFYPSITFTPTIEINTNETAKGHSFVHFFDLFFILLENIAKHGKNDQPPVKITMGSNAKFLTIEVENGLDGPESYIALKALAPILEERTKLYQAAGVATTEGGSGYYKLGRILMANLARNEAIVKVSVNESPAFRVTIEMECIGLVT